MVGPAVLDVRSDDEWADGRIEGSVNFGPLHELETRLYEVPSDEVWVHGRHHRHGRLRSPPAGRMARRPLVDLRRGAGTIVGALLSKHVGGRAVLIASGVVLAAADAC